MPTRTHEATKQRQQVQLDCLEAMERDCRSSVMLVEMCPSRDEAQLMGESSESRRDSGHLVVYVRVFVALLVLEDATVIYRI
mmetsp:Transcript_27350/g.45601  ORF Transcript_27350/g.45601 Transcript_27350/m.45601 type:complete len:82 (+) Transcript_27350:281-526(+)